jgi:hypothetical protein
MTIGRVVIPFAALLVLAASTLILRTRPFGRWVRWLGLAVGALSVAFVVLLMGPWASPLILIWVLAISVELARTRGARTIGVASPQVEARDQHLYIPEARWGRRLKRSGHSSRLNWDCAS